MTEVLRRGLVVEVWAVLVIAAGAEAQDISVDTPCADTMVLSGDVTDAVDAGLLRASVNDSSDVRQSGPEVSSGRFEITLTGPLTAGDGVVVSNGTHSSAPVEVAADCGEDEEEEQAEEEEEEDGEGRKKKSLPTTTAATSSRRPTTAPRSTTLRRASFLPI